MATEQPPGVGPLEDFYKRLRDGHEVKDITKVMERIWDEWADRYEEDYAKIGYQGPIFALHVMQKLLPDRQDALIIDCGAGTGLVGKQLHGAGYRNIVAVDLSEKSLKIASSRDVYKRVIKCAVGRDRLPFEDDEADVLITVGAMSPTLIPADSLPDQFRVVKPDGYVVTIQRKIQVGGSDAMVRKYNKKFAEILDEFRKAGKIEVEEEVLPHYVGGHEATLHICKML